MLEILENWDACATLAINALHSPISDPIWQFITGRWVWAPAYLVLAGILIWKLGWKRGGIMILATILTILCVDQTANLFKDFFARLRPCNDPDIIARGLHILEEPHPGYAYGFFSGHASNAMSFELCMIRAFRIYKNEHPEKTKAVQIGSALLIVWALLVGFSRVFVGKHFLGDVLVGFVIGALLAYLICLLGEFICKKIKA